MCLKSETGILAGTFFELAIPFCSRRVCQFFRVILVLVHSLDTDQSTGTVGHYSAREQDGNTEKDDAQKHDDPLGLNVLRS